MCGICAFVKSPPIDVPTKGRGDLFFAYKALLRELWFRRFFDGEGLQTEVRV